MNSDYQQALSVIEAFLTSPERTDIRMDIDEFQGAMVALLSHPDEPLSSELSFLALGNDSLGLDQWFSDEDILKAWLCFSDQLYEALSEERFLLADFYSLTESEPPESFRQWCHGYLLGYMECEAAWSEAHAFLATQDVGDLREDHDSMLSLFVAFAEWSETLKNNPDPQRFIREWGNIAEVLSDGVQRYFTIAAILEPEPVEQPYQREVEKVGRNDPCPCGSGKKYKKCCLV